MSFKEISIYKALVAQSFKKAKHLCNFDRGYNVRGTILRNYFEFGPVVQEQRLFKLFVIQCSGGPHVQRSGTFCAILVDDIMGNIYVKIF